MSIEDIKKEILEYGFTDVSGKEEFIGFTEWQNYFHKPFGKSNIDKIYCQVLLNWHVRPMVFIKSYCNYKGIVQHMMIVAGYDIREVGDFTDLMSRLSLELQGVVNVK